MWRACALTACRSTTGRSRSMSAEAGLGTRPVRFGLFQARGDSRLPRDAATGRRTGQRRSVLPWTTGTLVGVRGFEPPAPASRTQCSTRLSYTPAKAAHIAPAILDGKARLQPPGFGMSGRAQLTQSLQNSRRPLEHLVKLTHFSARETSADRRLARGEARGCGAGDVADQDRVAVQSGLPPGDDLDGLVQCSKATRQRDKRVGEFEHLLLPAVHGVGHDQLGGAPMRNLAPREEFGNDPD